MGVYTISNLAMPPFILIIFLAVTGTFFTQLFVLSPAHVLESFNIPGGIFLGLLALVLVWCFGE